MSEVWKKQFGKYDSLINSSFTLDDFLLTGKINIFDKSMKVSTKYKINKTKNESGEDGPLISSSEVSFSHKLFSKMSYTITQKQDTTSLNINYPLLKKGLSNLFLSVKTSFNNCEKLTELPSEIKFNYSNENENSLGGLCFEKYDPLKTIIPEIISLYYIKKGILFNKNVYGGVYSGFSIHKKHFKYNKIYCGCDGEKIRTIIDFIIEKNKDERQNDKIISVRSDVKLSNTLIVGGDTQYKTDEKKLNTRLFFNYNPTFDTKIKGKWEDKDKSVSINIVKSFRGLLKLGITGKFTTISKEESEKSSSFSIPCFKSKFGFNIDIDEAFV